MRRIGFARQDGLLAASPWRGEEDASRVSASELTRSTRQVGVSKAGTAVFPEYPHPMRHATWPGCRAVETLSLAGPSQWRIALPPPGGGDTESRNHRGRHDRT